jgi:hypothetical protein
MAQTLEEKHLEAMQESIAGFINSQVLEPAGEFYYNPDDKWVPKQ